MDNLGSSGIVEDGLRRLLDSPDHQKRQSAIEAKIREKHATELSEAKNFWQRLAIKAKIRREIRQSEPSPHSLWSSH
jgi:hypothetical protein